MSQSLSLEAAGSEEVCVWRELANPRIKHSVCDGVRELPLALDLACSPGGGADLRNPYVKEQSPRALREHFLSLGLKALYKRGQYHDPQQGKLRQSKAMTQRPVVDLAIESVFPLWCSACPYSCEPAFLSGVKLLNPMGLLTRADSRSFDADSGSTHSLSSEPPGGVTPVMGVCRVRPHQGM